MDKIKDFFHKNKGNKKFILISALAVVLVLGTVLLMFSLLNKEGNIFLSGSGEGEKFKEEYEKLNAIVTDDGKSYPEVKLPANNKIHYSTVKEVLNIFEEKGDAVVYFGYATCLYCRSAIEVLLDASSETKLDKIYYLDTEKEKGDYDKIGEYLKEEIAPGKKITPPLVVFIVDGVVVSYQKGTVFSQEDPYTELDQYQKDGLYEIYRWGINDVLGIINF